MRWPWDRVRAPALRRIRLVLGSLALARAVWLRRGLRKVIDTGARDLSTRRCITGDEVVVSVSIWNRSIMPVGWLTVEDEASDNFRLREVIAGGDASADGESAVYRELRNAWSLLPFERVERRFHLLADQRGRVAFGPAHLEPRTCSPGSPPPATSPPPSSSSSPHACCRSGRPINDRAGTRSDGLSPASLKIRRCSRVCARTCRASSSPHPLEGHGANRLAAQQAVRRISRARSRGRPGHPDRSRARGERPL